MHICFVAIDFHTKSGGGGIASYVTVLGEEFVRRGHKVTILAKGSEFKLFHENNIQVLIWPFSNISWYLYRASILRQLLTHPLREIEWSFNILKALRFLHQRQPIDIIESCETGNLFLHTMKLPTVIRLHGEPFVFAKYTHKKITPSLYYSRKLEFFSLARASAVTSPSLFQAQEMSKDLKWESNRIRVIPNPVAFHYLTSYRIEPQRPSDDQILLLYTGRIDQTKGSLILIRAMKKIVQQIPNVYLSIAGNLHNSISKQTLDEELAATECANHINLLGHIPWNDLIQLYRQASVFIMPSYYETFSISCAEAMALGVPVIATRVGGIPEVVEENETGLLVPAGDVDALSDAVCKLILDPALRTRMSSQGHKRVESSFSPQRIADQTLSLYANVIKCYKAKSSYTDHG